MVEELLKIGRDHARPGRELAEALHVAEAWLEWPVMEERYQGAPICCTFLSKGQREYYLASDREELLQSLCEAREALQEAAGPERRRALRNYQTTALLLRREHKGEVDPWQRLQTSRS